MAGDIGKGYAAVRANTDNFNACGADAGEGAVNDDHQEDTDGSGFNRAKGNAFSACYPKAF